MNLTTRSFLAFWIERANAALMLQTEKIAQEKEQITTRQWWIIADMFAERPETAAELCRIADIDKGLLSRNLKVLIEKGLVETRDDPKDQRRQIISLTERGEALHNRLLPVMQERNQSIIRDFTDKEIEAAVDVLRAVEHTARRTRF